MLNNTRIFVTTWSLQCFLQTFQVLNLWINLISIYLSYLLPQILYTPNNYRLCSQVLRLIHLQAVPYSYCLCRYCSFWSWFYHQYIGIISDAHSHLLSFLLYHPISPNLHNSSKPFTSCEIERLQLYRNFGTLTNNALQSKQLLCHILSKYEYINLIAHVVLPFPQFSE